MLKITEGYISALTSDGAQEFLIVQPTRPQLLQHCRLTLVDPVPPTRLRRLPCSHAGSYARPLSLQTCSWSACHVRVADRVFTGLEVPHCAGIDRSAFKHVSHIDAVFAASLAFPLIRTGLVTSYPFRK